MRPSQVGEAGVDQLDASTGRAAHLGSSADLLVAPAAVRLIDLDEPVSDLVLSAGPAGYRTALLLFRGGGHILGTAVVAPDPDGRVPAELLHDIAADWLRIVSASSVPRSPNGPRPAMSVVIPTCGNPFFLDRCLRSLLASGRADEIIVVDNRPANPLTRDLLDREYSSGPEIRYVAEPRRGLSHARNAGIAAATGDVVALLDDDIVADPELLDRLAEPFAADPAVACVTGLIAPLELETPAQVQLEQFATFGKGFATRAFTLEQGRALDPSFPYAAGQLGSGANIAVRTTVARKMDGFDVRLGTGTLARGGEDLDFFVRVLLDGGTLVYEPRALVWHQHAPEYDTLLKQVYSYGVGLTAMLSKHILESHERRRILRSIPTGIRHVVDPRSRKNASKAVTYPRSLNYRERLGMAMGPVAFVRSVVAHKVRERRA